MENTNKIVLSDTVFLTEVDLDKYPIVIEDGDVQPTNIYIAWTNRNGVPEFSNFVAVAEWEEGLSSLGTLSHDKAISIFKDGLPDMGKWFVSLYKNDDNGETRSIRETLEFDSFREAYDAWNDADRDEWDDGLLSPHLPTKNTIDIPNNPLDNLTKIMLGR